MVTAVRFFNLDRSDILESVVRDTFEGVLSRQESRLRTDAYMDVCIRLDGQNGEKPGPRTFHCELIVSSSRFPKIFVRRSGENFYKAVAAAAVSLQKLLERMAIRVLRPAKEMERGSIETFYFLGKETRPHRTHATIGRAGRRPRPPFVDQRGEEPVAGARV